MIHTAKKVVTFGEVMLRLSTPGNQRFSQATALEVTYGGGEANVAISLSYLGLSALHVARFPDHMVGRAVSQYLRKHGVDTSYILNGGKKMGSYFMEVGAGHRASEIVYDRAGSSFSEIQPDMVDWSKILADADWFHWSGITPAISQTVADTCLEAIQIANELGVKVSGDVHSRKSLWQYGKSPKDIMPALLRGSDYLIGGAFDFASIFTDIGEEEDMITTRTKLTSHCPRLIGLIDKDRDILSASHNRIRGKYCCENGQLWTSDWFEIDTIVDRVGTGDAYAAGIIYGLMNFDDKRFITQFGTAACALKHTIPGDANLVGREDIMALAIGEASGRIKR